MSLPVTACSIINQLCWIFSQNVLYDVLRRYLKFDHNSLLGMGGMSQRILSISHRECTGGGGGQKLPPLVHSLWEMDGTQWYVTLEHNSNQT